MGEKTEKATPKKLRDAKKKGQVAKSQDLPSAFTFIVSIWATLAMGGFLYHNLSEFTIGAFRAVATHTDLLNIISQLFLNSFVLIFVCSMPILTVVSVLGVLVNFLVVGPVFATEVFK